MKCPNCGADVIGNTCEFCGSQLSETVVTKACCSKCGSSKVTFKRENAGEYRNGKSKRIVHRTVGYCQDCGNTWYIGEDIPPKRRTWLWVIGWILIFPLPLTVLLLRKKNMKPAVKYGIIAAAWIIYLLIALFSPSDSESVNNPSSENQPAAQEVSSQNASSSFVLLDGEMGDYGVEVVVNKGTEFEETEIAYHIPPGIYEVKNLDTKAVQVTVYCGGPVKNGEWEEFVADENCASPLVLMASDSADFELKAGQFVVLSDEASNIQFSMK